MWGELTGGMGPCYFDECPYYESCGGWTWDPPCGGCDSCIWAQMCHYDDGTFTVTMNIMHTWSKLQAACA